MEIKAVLVSLHISQWLPVKDDKKISNEVAAEHAATQKAGKYRKYLFPENTFPELKKVLSELAKLYTWHADITGVWDGDGVRVLPLARAEEHRAKVDAVIASLPQLLADMQAGYAQAKLRAQVALGTNGNGMYRESDYPAANELCAKFGVSREYSAIPAEVTDGSLPASIASLVNETTASRVSAGVDALLRDAWDRLYNSLFALVSGMEKIGKEGQRFHASLVENVRATCEVLKTLNVTGDSELERMRTEISAAVSGFDIATLRDNEGLRNAVAQNVGSALAQVKQRTIQKVR